MVNLVEKMTDRELGIEYEYTKNQIRFSYALMI